MISVNNLFVQFSGNALFDHVTFIINSNDRIGLVGKNGSGKTTLLKIICSLQEPESGEVVVPKDVSLGYLPQEMKIDSTKSVYDETLTAFAEAISIKERIDKLSIELGEREDYDSAEYMRKVNELTEINEQFQIIGGQSMDAEIEKVLKGLGFKPSDFSRSMTEFSMGWQMRVELAKLLLRKPKVLLLDEPTNHLDIESIQWLEGYLINYFGAVVIVSHDRAFLDNITKRTIEISMGKIYDYRASYSEYVKLREDRLSQQLATYNNQQKQIKQVERFIERFRYKNTKASQVQSRVKMLEKMETVEIDDIDTSSIHFKFPPAPHSGKIVVETEELGKSYGNHEVLRNVDFTAIKGEKIAFVGKNGEGKTTFSRVILQQLDYSGKLKHGQNVKIGYYAQDQSEMLDPNLTVFDTLDEVAVGDIRKQIRTILGSFLFSGETIDKKVKVLSGGEKSRLALAKLLLEPVNLLVLDEPTNHLDMASKDILKNALLMFDGTLIIVSHDRDFLQGLTNRVIEFRNKGIKDYKGDIYDYLYMRKLADLKELEEVKKNGEEAPRQDSDNKQKYLQKKETEREIRKLKTRIGKCEEEIEQLENEISKMDERMADPENNKEAIQSGELAKAYKETQDKLDKVMEEWEELNLKLEQL